ncbi:hypothetical protein DSL72_006332 [Monilinia vaccinii-corymbosi]|uniref:Uncharacterized protein n=1 Tax=Monilinia vaccinii-corymbosi TaxID=61207 RepID=A0A8A3PN72_9HELO|nr:hypothetical protein DSL72_006332 [Monilinia vaccinii-corymbosi]
MQRSIFLLLFIASRAEAGGTDVTNNLLSDLAPLLALFGDTFAQRFLRESFTWLDHIIFAMAPLGILTVIIGAIRVGGPPLLKALIGRARENRASAELDFMSSTSHEVSELWNGDGIVRTIGNGKVQQILFLKDRGASNNLGLYTLSLAENEGLMTRKAYRGPLVQKMKRSWEKARKLWKTLMKSVRPDNNGSNHDRPQVGEEHQNDSKRNNYKRGKSGSDDLDRAPNISLNIHPKQNRRELFVAAVLGIVLQISVIIFSAFVAYDNRFGAMVGGRPSAYAFPTLASGTAVLVFGMGICSLVIGESTDESVWEPKLDENSTTIKVKGNHQPNSDDVEKGDRRRQEIRVFWLQKRFVVSDQTFDSYMLVAGMEKELIMTSCRSSDDSSDGNSSHSTSQDCSEQARTPPAFRTPSSDPISQRIATSPLLGSTAQKPLSSSKPMPPNKPASILINTLCVVGASTGIIVFLVAILIMTIIRAIIRRGMLDRPIAVKIPEKYEMDWLALRIGSNPNFLRDLSISGDPSNTSTCDIPADDCEVSFWKVSNEITPPTQAVLGSEPITSESLAQDVCNIRGCLQKLVSSLEASTNASMQQDLPDIRRLLEDNTALWKPSRKEPVAQDVHTIQECLQKITASWKPTIKETAAQEVLTMLKRLQELTGWLKLIGWLEPSKESSRAQDVVNVRKRLQELTPGRSNPEIKASAASVAIAIEKIMALFSGWPGSTFYWLIDVQIEESTANAANKVKLKVTKRPEEKDSWHVSTSDIESIMSL